MLAPQFWLWVVELINILEGVKHKWLLEFLLQIKCSDLFQVGINFEVTNLYCTRCASLVNGSACLNAFYIAKQIRKLSYSKWDQNPRSHHAHRAEVWRLATESASGIHTDHNGYWPTISLWITRNYTSTRAVPFLRRLVAGFRPLRPRFEPETSYVGFVVDKVSLGQVFSEYFGFPCQISFHQLLHTHHLSSGAGGIGQTVAAVPSRLSQPMRKK
jgi:hypothetical protein